MSSFNPDMCFLIRDDGDVECLYTDKINLRSIGVLNVSRASFVEWDHGLKAWVVTIVMEDNTSGRNYRLGPFDSREEALKEEIEFINNHYLNVEKQYDRNKC